jgi:repressor LexA
MNVKMDPAAKAKGLTTRQRDVLAFLAKFTGEKHFSPSIRQIASAVGIVSPSTIHNHLIQLETKGFIGRQDATARSLTVTSKGYAALDLPDPSAHGALTTFGAEEQFVNIPLVGRIAAGEPILAEQNIEDIYSLPKSLVGDSASFMLAVRGDSMIGAGINSGDFVVVKEQPTANNGDIVVALIDDGATVKTFYRESDRIRLQPQNPTMDPIYPTDVQVLGKVIALFRSL